MRRRHLVKGILMVLGALMGVAATDASLEAWETKGQVEYRGDQPPE
jgi:hypothetical protein